MFEGNVLAATQEEINIFFPLSVILLSALMLLLAFLMSGVWRASYVLEYTTPDGKTHQLVGNSFAVTYKEEKNSVVFHQLRLGQSVSKVYLSAQTYIPSTIGGLSEVHLRDELVTQAILRN